MWRAYIREHPRFGSWYTRVEREPSWTIRAAVTAAVLVVVVPLVLLILAALMVGGIVFLFASVLARLKAIWSRSDHKSALRRDGRENVRVVQR